MSDNPDKYEGYLFQPRFFAGLGLTDIVDTLAREYELVREVWEEHTPEEEAYQDEYHRVLDLLTTVIQMHRVGIDVRKKDYDSYEASVGYTNKQEDTND